MIGPCSVFGCGAPILSHCLCGKHYKAWLRHGDPTINKRSTAQPKPVGHKPPKGPRPFHGPCSQPGCGKVAGKTGLCERHGRVYAKPGATPARPMLSIADLENIRANRNGLAVQQLADWFKTTPSTVVAVQAGRNWGYLLD